ncbi:MAG: hypothetical protein ACFFDC_17120, partial [Promethearchaeota archaeon]
SNVCHVAQIVVDQHFVIKRRRLRQIPHDPFYFQAVLVDAVVFDANGARRGCHDHCRDFKETINYFDKNLGIPVTFISYKPTSNDIRLPITSQQIKEAERVKTDVFYGTNVPIIPQCVSKFYCGTTASIIPEIGNPMAGNFTVCSRIRQSFGKLKLGQSFKDEFNRVKEILLTRKLKEVINLPKDCQQCAYNNICWGCRSNAWYYLGDIFAGDPRCWRRSHEKINRGD